MTSIYIPLHRETEALLFNFSNFKIVPQNQSPTAQEPVLQLIAGDASDRKFFRLINNKEGNAICMQFPKWEGGYGGDPISWIGMYHALNQMGLPVPKILEVDETNACIWTEDLGDQFLTSILPDGKLDHTNPNCLEALSYYKEALSLLIKAQYPNTNWDHPAANRFFDFEKLFYEMNFFITHFLNGLLKLDVQEEQKQWKGLFDDFKILCRKLADYERVLCHRDYHVRNLMLKEKKLYWIDFQDARMGPHSYDVVSLVRDSYVPITWETREHLFSYYLDLVNDARNHKNLKPISYADFHLESLLMGLQRNIKAIGSFGYLATKKGKSSYLNYVKQTLEILTSPKAQIHEETDLTHLMPHVYELIDNLSHGPLSKKLNKIVESYS